MEENFKKWTEQIEAVKAEIEEFYLNDDELDQSDHHDELHNWFSHVGLSLEEATEGLGEILKVIAQGRTAQGVEEEEEDEGETVGRF